MSLPSLSPPSQLASGVSAEAIRHVQTEVRKLKLRGLELYGAQGRYCYIRHDGEPLCRFGWRGEMDKLDFAIYKYSTGRYSTNEAFFPLYGKIAVCLRTATPRR
jgi:hypothetical protein